MLRLLFFAVLCESLGSAAAPFSFPVYRVKLTRDEPGQLEVTESGVHYRANKKRTTVSLSFPEIRLADLSDPKKITLGTFEVTKRRLGGHNTVSFRLREGTTNEELARFFAARVKRPVIGAYTLQKEGGVFEIPAYHRELMGRAHGTVIIGPDGITFVSEKAKQSRTWLYRDIETIGTSNPFSFRVSTYAETFTFDLMDRLPEKAYRLAVEKVYRLELAPSNRVERQ